MGPALESSRIPEESRTDWRTGDDEDDAGGEDDAGDCTQPQDEAHDEDEAVVPEEESSRTGAAAMAVVAPAAKVLVTGRAVPPVLPWEETMPTPPN